MFHVRLVYVVSFLSILLYMVIFLTHSRKHLALGHSAVMIRSRTRYIGILWCIWRSFSLIHTSPVFFIENKPKCIEDIIFCLDVLCFQVFYGLGLYRCLPPADIVLVSVSNSSWRTPIKHFFVSTLSFIPFSGFMWSSALALTYLFQTSRASGLPFLSTNFLSPSIRPWLP